MMQPVRFIRFPQTCRFCWRDIPPGRPGTRTGERGTKAYFDPTTREWECIPCHDELTRANLAREALGMAVLA